MDFHSLLTCAFTFGGGLKERREGFLVCLLSLSSTSANDIAGTVGGGLEGSLKMTKVISLSFRPHAHTISLISLFLLVSFSLSIQKGVTKI